MTDQSDNDYEYWSRTAGTYDDDNEYIVGDVTNEAVREWLDGQFEASDEVLELGCGTGFTSSMIANKVGHLTVTDMSDEMLEVVKGKLGGFENVRIQAEDCYRTSFEDGTFDAVLLANVIHVVREPKVVMNEARRVLKDGGRIVVVDYTSYGLDPDEKKSMMRRYFSRWGAIPPLSFAASVEGLTELAEKCGFVVEDAVMVGEGSNAVCLRGRK